MSPPDSFQLLPLLSETLLELASLLPISCTLFDNPAYGLLRQGSVITANMLYDYNTLYQDHFINTSLFSSVIWSKNIVMGIHNVAGWCVTQVHLFGNSVCDGLESRNPGLDLSDQILPPILWAMGGRGVVLFVLAV